MEAAVDQCIVGIGGDCSGVGSCGTCHVHIAPEWMERVGTATESEIETLKSQKNASPYSRLACQIELTEKLHGLIVRIPAAPPRCLAKADSGPLSSSTCYGEE